MFDDFAGHPFWTSIRQFVISKGVEPISDGEPEDELWQKIFAAMALNGTSLSLGMTPGEIMRALTAALSTGVGVSYSAEATALFARFTTPPTDARKTLINNLIVSLKTAGVWAKLDALNVMAAADSQSARQNWVQDAFNLTAVNGPAFTADRGYTGDGSSSYLATGFTPSTAGGKLIQDSASMGLWSRTAAASLTTGNYDMGANSGGANRADLRARRSDDTAAFPLNDATAAIVPSTDGSGFFCSTRQSAGTRRLRRNATQLSTQAIASTGLPITEITLLAANGFAFGSRQLAAGFIGAGLSDAESDAFYSALSTYLTAVGAA